MTHIDNIALFDLDGALCDYDLALKESLEKLKSPSEITSDYGRDNEPDYLTQRRKIITSAESWWENLPKFNLGFDVLNIAKSLDYRIMILTQGPSSNPNAWSGKMKWVHKNLGKNVDVTMTRDKSLVYGKILVDDYLPYIEGWLGHRKRGHVIMPAQRWNEDYLSKSKFLNQITRYDSSNIEQVKEIFQRLKKGEN